MKVKKITVMNKNVYKVQIERKHYIFYEPIIVKYNIFKDKEFSKEEIKEMVEENKLEKIINNILYYLNLKMRTKKEVFERLEKYKINDLEKEKIIKGLEDKKYLNDENYTKIYINSKLRMTNWGPLKIKEKLKIKGIESEIINKEINNISKKDVKIKLKRIVIKRNKTKEKTKEKLYVYLTNLGYPKEMILDEIKKNDN